MAASKTWTSLAASVTLTAGASDTTEGPVDLSTGYGATLNISLTNGATGPTVAAQVQVQVANDYNSGSPHLWVNYGGPLVAGVLNFGVYQWTIELPLPCAAVQIVAGENTDQDVTLDADISVVTGI